VVQHVVCGQLAVAETQRTPDRHADIVLERDSLKDETVVVIFIFATAGLLSWALVKPWVDKLRDRAAFAPVAQQDRGHLARPIGSRQRGFRDASSPSVGSSNGKRPVNGRDGQTAIPSYDESIHADHDAEDIVSASPGGSNMTFGRGPRI
jgi:hypothetical protein